MRLGDLNALKAEMDRPFWEKWEWEFICKSIDNAPTVESYKEKYDNMKEAYRLLSTAYEYEVTKEERPQGEWIEVGDNQPYSKDKLYGCSECGFGGYLLSDTKNVNFCLNCGAKMQKGGAK